MNRRQATGKFPHGDSEVSSTAVFASNIPNKRDFFFGDHDPVFVDNVESVKTPEAITVPSAVRLYGIDNEVNDDRWNLIPQPAIDGSYKFFSGFINWEFGESASFPVPEELDIVYDKVQSRHEVVDGVPDDQRDFIGDGLIEAEFKDAIPSIRVVLHRNIVRAALVGDYPFALEIADVFFGPMNF